MFKYGFRLGLPLLGLLILMVLGWSRLFPYPSLVNPAVEQFAEVKGLSVSSNPAPEIASPAGKPAQLIIPKLNLAAGVEPVGQDERGRMDVPQNPANVSWWMLGTLPGQTGSAVMAGHLDTPGGQPAVFYALDELALGDEIMVVDEFGSTRRFAVTDVAVYADAAFPIEQVFQDQSTTRLNLITCDGTFDQQTKNYEDRLVVYTELIPG